MTFPPEHKRITPESPAAIPTFPSDDTVCIENESAGSGSKTFHVLPSPEVAKAPVLVTAKNRSSIQVLETKFPVIPRSIIVGSEDVTSLTRSPLSPTATVILEDEDKDVTF